MIKKRKIITPKDDDCFKHIFGKVGNEDITKEFLNLIIDSEITEIDLSYNTNENRKNKKKKSIGLDVKAKLNSNIWCDIEIQVKDYKDITQRSLYYWSRIYSSQLEKGDRYKLLQKTILILITDYELEELKEVKKTISQWSIREKDEKNHKIVLTPYLEFYIIEIPKLKRYKDLGEELTRWLKFIDNPEVLEMGEYKKSKTLEKAKKEYEGFAGRDAAFWEAEAELRARADWNAELDLARSEGAEASQIEIAKKLLKRKFSINDIVEITGLSKEEVENIKKELE